MKISELWLRESVDLAGITRSQLLEKLTAAGLEVESCEDVAPVFSGVVVAEIITCEKHPDADKLRVCNVSVGAGELLQIVCGAPNARVGLKAPLAMVDAVLPGGVHIKTGKLRGVESFGMLCSSTELGLPAGIDGLYELPADAPVGSTIREYLQLEDAIIELKMTPNRSDCLGVLGLTRELCALFNRPSRRSNTHAVAPLIPDFRNIELTDPVACPRYLGQVVKGIDAAATTPLWMKERLRRSGIRSIHPIVDITNYVLIEFGQPMHAFDLQALCGGIEVRRARVGETLKLLDEQVVSLDEKFLVIANAERGDDSTVSGSVLAIAGVMGGYESRVTELSANVFFESAHFAPEVIMGRARALGLHTDASHRFERGVDPNLPELALARAVALTIEICGGQAGPVCRAEQLTALPSAKPVELRQSKLDELLGHAVPAQQIASIFNDLGFQVTPTGTGWKVVPHSARFDIAIEEDLIEEIARVHGYDQIPVRLPSLRLTPLATDESKKPLADIRRILSARDYFEAITFAFTSSEGLKDFGLVGHPIKNPLSAEIDVMRPSLLPNLLSAVAQNQRRQLDRVRLFELGVVFLENGTIEPSRIAGVAVGSASCEQWAEPSREIDFYDIKGDIEALMGKSPERLTFDACNSETAPAYLHPGRSALVLIDNQIAGYAGQLHPSLAKKLDLRGAALVFELDLSCLQDTQVPKAKALSKFPSARRDLAIVLQEQVSFAALERCVRGACGPILAKLDCFDVYRGSGLENGHKSLAISLILQDFSRTLSDEEVEASVQRVIVAIAAELQGSIRS